MGYLSNAAVNRLNIHNGLFMLAANLAGNFFLVFLLSRGFSTVEVLLAFAGLLATRFVLRPLALIVIPRLGAGKSMVLGNSFMVLQYLLLPHVHGLDVMFFLYCVAQALADCVYWTTYHAVYAHMGDNEHRGKQLGVRQAISIITSIFAPLLGGLALDHFGATVTFGIAATIQFVALLPLYGLPKIAFARQAPEGAFKAGLSPAKLFYSDSWYNLTLTMIWGILLFASAQNSFATLGEVFALAGVVGSVGALVLGRFIDNGHAHQAALFNGFFLALDAVLRMSTGRSLAAMCGITAMGSLLGASYMPILMTAFYNQVGRAPCSLRCMFVCEGAWDWGGITAALTAAGLLTLGAPFWCVIGLAFAGILFQTTVLVRYYKASLPIAVPQTP